MRPSGFVACLWLCFLFNQAIASSTTDVPTSTAAAATSSESTAHALNQNSAVNSLNTINNQGSITASTTTGAPKAVGENCTDTLKCQANLLCQDGSCKAKKDAACNSSHECQTGTTCSNKTCTVAQGRVGSSCNATSSHCNVTNSKCSSDKCICEDGYKPTEDFTCTNSQSTLLTASLLVILTSILGSRLT